MRNFIMEVEVLGDYILLEKLGEGTFGSVYLAEHRFIKKKYAIKIFSEEFSSDKEFIKSFENNIGILSTLDHPSILKVHNISAVDNRYFLVMDVAAENLENYLKRKKDLKEKEAEIILRQIASALDYAHDLYREKKEEASLIHRSIKLSNIFIEESSAGLRVCLSDFGHAKILGEDKVLLKNYEHLLATKFSSGFLNNFYFLSPEQKNGGEVTVASDTYSFGVLAYYLITGKFPEGYFELPTALVPEYKLDWNLFICKCLQPDPSKRPERLIEALNVFLKKNVSDLNDLNVLSWEEVERKVENAMQMSFDFSSFPEEKTVESESDYSTRDTEDFLDDQKSSNPK